MAIIKDNAICIRCSKYSETSQIVTLFTRNNGKIQAIAKGSRRAKGNFSGGLDILSAGEVLFSPARGESSLATLTEFVLQQDFRQLRTNLLLLHCGQFMAFLMDKFFETADPHPAMYDTFLSSLGKLIEHPLAVLIKFELNLLQQTGQAPVWNRCCSCNKPFIANQRVYFSSSEGGLLCRDCEPAIMEKRSVAPDVLPILQNHNIITKTYPQSLLKCQDILYYHIREILGRENSIMKLTNQLLRQEIHKIRDIKQ